MAVAVESAYDHFQKVAVTTVRIEEHVQTMCRPAAAAGWIVRRVDWEEED